MNTKNSIKEYFRRGTRLFYENADKIPLNEIYDRILALFFHRGKELRKGVFVPLLPPAGELPTLSQYRYWYRMERDCASFVASRGGLNAFDAGERAVLERLRQTISGPGRLFQIHVVIAGIYLISMLDRRRILRRPVNHIIVDVFSVLIVVMSVSLEGPSRQGAILAVENMAQDKVADCREYGLSVLCRLGNFSARRGNWCFFLSSDKPGCHLPSVESQFRHFPSPQTTNSAAFLIGDNIKVKLKARWYDSTSLFFFFSPNEERCNSAAFLIGDTVKVKLKASWYDSPRLILFFSPNEERSNRSVCVV